jgi:hypothetical protein
MYIYTTSTTNTHAHNDHMKTNNTYVDAFSERQTLNKNRGGALCTGADGPRAGAGRSAAWCEAR